MRRSWVALLALALSTTVGAQQPPAASSSSGRIVRMDVFATDARGRTIDNLKPNEFELREEGTLQTIDEVRFVQPARLDDAAPIVIRTSADEQAAAGRQGARLFALFLDEYHVSPANVDRVRAALTRFVERDLTPHDLVVVMKPLDSLFALRMTSDRDAMRESIAGFDGRKGDYQPRNSYERNFIAGTPARIDAARNQVAWSAVNALALHIGRLGDGRKTLIVVSEGVDAMDRRRGQESLPNRDTVIRSANRSNVAVYTLDPRDVSPADAADAAGALQTIATETDGAAVTGDLDAGLRRASRDSAGYYVLTYRSARPDDGHFHPVEVRAIRQGVRLRARKGFVAAPPDEALRRTLLAHANDPKPVAPPEPAPHVSTLVRPWFGISQGPAGKSRVTFVWEPAARVPGDRSIKVSAARLVLTARGADGSLLFEGPVAPTGPAAIDEPGATPARAVFDVLPGRLRLRMSIQDVTSRVLDLDVRDISIRELKGVAIGTPEVLRSRNAREFRSLDTDNAVPVAAREFSRTERLLIRFPAYGPADAPPSVSAKLLTRTGQPMRDLPLLPAAGADVDHEHEIDLSLANLAPGEYVVEVAASTASGDVRDRVGFRVTP
jgi:VWFA-related protein